ncbi:MAG: hypothetical protein AAGD18_21430 [Actinomycetota bacterium]
MGAPRTTDTALAPRPWWLAIPTALWLYGLLRSLAFAAPAWSSGGRIGLGALVVAALFVWTARGSRRSWAVLAWLDTVSLVMLVAAWSTVDGAAVAAPVLAAAAMATLWAPSIRCHVAAGTR